MQPLAYVLHDVLYAGFLRDTVWSVLYPYAVEPLFSHLVTPIYTFFGLNPATTYLFPGVWEAFEQKVGEPVTEFFTEVTQEQVEYWILHPLESVGLVNPPVGDLGGAGTAASAFATASAASGAAGQPLRAEESTWTANVQLPRVSLYLLRVTTGLAQGFFFPACYVLYSQVWRPEAFTEKSAGRAASEADSSGVDHATALKLAAGRKTAGVGRMAAAVPASVAACYILSGQITNWRVACSLAGLAGLPFCMLLFLSRDPYVCGTVWKYGGKTSITAARRAKSAPSADDGEIASDAGSEATSASASSRSVLTNGSRSRSSVSDEDGIEAPRTSSAAPLAEPEAHGASASIWKVFRSRAFAAVLISHFANNWGHMLLLAWLPTFFGSKFASLAALPYLAAGIAAPVFPEYTERLLNSKSSASARAPLTHLWRVRRELALVGLALPAAILYLVSFSSPGRQEQMPFQAAMFSLFLMTGAATHSSVLAAPLDLAGPAHAGSLIAVVNAVGAVAGAVAVKVAGLVSEWYGWAAVFQLCVGLYIFASAVYVSWGDVRRLV